ncbi:MAG: carbon-nitrogen hydrolase [Candidatus Eremiobacteraeota bacterium]|nr:carbon-nitrogen hydrolase [Candidatus Eremiobacteraeota bacterium]
MCALTLGLVQHHCTEKRSDNIDRTIAGIREAVGRGARLVVLQELHESLYFCQEENVAFFDDAAPIPGPLTDFYGALAKETSIVLVASLFERRAPGLYHNTAVIFDKGGYIGGIYRKMHIPDDPAYYEKFYFAPGDRGFMPVRTSLGTLGVMICWDQWYPEAARLMALAGADILIYPSAIGWDPRDLQEEKNRQLEAWITVQRGHAIANGLHVVAVNRVGFEGCSAEKGGQLFWGNSFVAGPQGEILARASYDRDEVVTVEISLARTEEVRRIWPFLRDRRIDSYGDILKRYRS